MLCLLSGILNPKEKRFLGFIKNIIHGIGCLFGDCRDEDGKKLVY